MCTTSCLYATCWRRLGPERAGIQRRTEINDIPGVDAVDYHLLEPAGMFHCGQRQTYPCSVTTNARMRWSGAAMRRDAHTVVNHVACGRGSSSTVVERAVRSREKLYQRCVAIDPSVVQTSCPGRPSTARCIHTKCSRVYRPFQNLFTRNALSHILPSAVHASFHSTCPSTVGHPAAFLPAAAATTPARSVPETWP